MLSVVHLARQVGSVLSIPSGMQVLQSLPLSDSTRTVSRAFAVLRGIKKFALDRTASAKTITRAASSVPVPIPAVVEVKAGEKAEQARSKNILKAAAAAIGSIADPIKRNKDGIAGPVANWGRMMAPFYIKNPSPAISASSPRFAVILLWGLLI